MHDHPRSAFRGPFDHNARERGQAGRFPGGTPWEGMFPGRGPRGFGGGFGPGPRGFGPGPRARRGDVRSALLGLLEDGPSNGYGLIKSIAERTEGAWSPSPGSVYPTLAQLVDEGLVAQADGPRGAYSLTEAGRTYVEEHRSEIESAFAFARGDHRGDDEFFTAARKLAGAVMQFRGSASAEQRMRATEKLDELRRELYRILGE